MISPRLLVDKAYALVYADVRTAKQYFEEFINILNIIADERNIDKETVEELKHLAEWIMVFKTKWKGYDNKIVDATVDRFLGTVFDLYDQLIK